MKFTKRVRAWILEAVIGFTLAGLVVVVSWASTGEVPFVYRGL